MLCGGDSTLLYTLTALPSDPLSFATHPWTLVTYMVAHFAPLHMLFNMLWLYWFGMMFADSGRDRALPWLYAGAGIAGGVFYLAASVISGHAPGTYLTGASAAVLGVMTATAMLMPSRSIGLFLIGDRMHSAHSARFMGSGNTSAGSPYRRNSVWHRMGACEKKNLRP